MGTSSVFFPASGIDSANIEATRHCDVVLTVKPDYAIIKPGDVLAHNDFATLADDMLQNKDFALLSWYVDEASINREQFPKFRDALIEALRRRNNHPMAGS
jgi:hypothetical protein